MDAQPVGRVERGEAAQHAGRCDAVVPQRKQRHFERELFAAFGLALEGDQRHRMILGHRPHERFERVMVAHGPERGEGAGLEFPAIGRADMGTGQPEGKIDAVVRFENEGLGQRVANPCRVDITAFRGGTGAANLVPIGVERFRRALLHFIPGWSGSRVGKARYEFPPTQRDSAKFAAQKRS